MKTAFVYYHEVEGKTRIKSISIKKLSLQNASEWNSVLVDYNLVYDFITGHRNVGQVYLEIENGQVSFISEETDDILLYNENTFNQIKRTTDSSVGLFCLIHGDGKFSIETCVDRHTYPNDALVQIHITGWNEPNLIMGTMQIPLKSFEETEVLSGLPEGFPDMDYSIWAVTPGPQTPLYWKRQNG